VDRELRAEAERLLTLGLLDLLRRRCAATIVGSYALNLMTWRDLDLYGDATGLGMDDIYAIVHDIIPVYHPVWFEAKEDDMGQGRCFFVGFETDVLESGRWNVDIWLLQKDVLDREIASLAQLRKEITPEIQQTILRLKAVLSSQGDYGIGSTIHSIHLYEAVIKHRLTTVEQIRAWMKEQVSP
jgi:hypothetical protein